MGIERGKSAGLQNLQEAGRQGFGERLDARRASGEVADRRQATLHARGVEFLFDFHERALERGQIVCPEARQGVCF